MPGCQVCIPQPKPIWLASQSHLTHARWIIYGVTISCRGNRIVPGQQVRISRPTPDKAHRRFCVFPWGLLTHPRPAAHDIVYLPWMKKPIIYTCVWRACRSGHRARVMIFIYTHADDSSGDLFYNSRPQAGSLPDVGHARIVALWRAVLTLNTVV